MNTQPTWNIVATPLAQLLSLLLTIMLHAHTNNCGACGVVCTGDNIVWTSYAVYNDFEALIKHAR